MTNLLTVIPFTGFYESEHDAMIDDEINMTFETDDGGNHNIPDEMYMNGADYQAMHTEYARLYCAEFADAFNDKTGANIHLAFESLKSPKYYNFETDRIYAHITEPDALSLFEMSARDNHATLRVFIANRFTSRDGFASFYSNDLDVWMTKPFLSWDHNELETLILAVLSLSGADFDRDDSFRAHNLMDRARGNGRISSLVTDNIKPEVLAFADYQRESGEAQDFERWKGERKS